MLYKLFKDDLDATITPMSDYEIAVLKKDSDFHFGFSGKEILLTSLGIDFVKSVNGRLDSLQNQKHNYALFDGLGFPAPLEYIKKVTKYIKNGFKTTDREALVLGYPESKLDFLEASKPIIMSYDVVEKAMTKDSEHILTASQILSLPEEINKPIIAFISSARTAPKNSFVIVTEMLDDNKQNVMVAIQVTGYILRKEGNKILSVYSKLDSKFFRDLREAAAKNNIVFSEEVKTKNWLRRNGEFQLLTMLQSQLWNDKNTKKSQTTKNKRKKNNPGLGQPDISEIPVTFMKKWVTKLQNR